MGCVLGQHNETGKNSRISSHVKSIVSFDTIIELMILQGKKIKTRDAKHFSKLDVLIKDQNWFFH